MAENFDLFGLLSGASFAAGIAVLVVAAARLILKKAPKRWSYIMWIVVFFRCLCPFAAESSVSIFNALNFTGTALTSETAEADVTANSSDVSVSEPAPVTDGGYVPYAPSETFQSPVSEEYIVNTENVWWDSYEPASNNIQNVYNNQDIQNVDEKQPGQIEQPEVADIKNGTDSRTIFIIVWLCGVGAMALYGIVSAARLAARVKTAVRTEKGIYESDRISTAFAAGLLRPKIYIPCGIPEDERRLIVMHERVHIRRRDYLFKLLAFAGLSLHWFNPLIWAAFALMTRDMEMSCDEAVLKECGESGRILYAEALLRVSVKGFGGAAVVGFGETGIKERVKNVLNYKKQGKLAAIAAAMVMLASCTMAGTDAVDGGHEDTSADSTSANVSEAGDNKSNGADGENVGGNEENTEADDAFVYSYNEQPGIFGRSIMLSAREPLVVIYSLEADIYNSKNAWLIPIDRTGGISGMGAENFIIDDDGVITATFRIHCGDRKVISPVDGEVLWADNTCVVLDTEYGAVTYGDMKEVELKAGDKVVKRDTLGRTAGDGYTGYAVQASMSVTEAYRDIDCPISSLYCIAGVSNGAYTYTSSDARFLGDNADNVRLLETVDLYEKTPWYEAGDGKEFHGTSFSAFEQISDMADGEQLRQKQNNTDSKLSEQELRLQEELRRLQEEEERQKKEEAERRRQMEEAANAEKFSYPFSQFPLSAADIGEYGANEQHVLFAVPKGTAVLAAEDGTVESAKKDFNIGYGLCMEISHDDEMSTFYAHLDEFAVKVGDKVKKGDVIAYSGNSGYTEGDALLFEIRKDGIYEDPRNYYSFSEDGYRRALEEIGKDYDGDGWHALLGIQGIYYEDGNPVYENEQETIKVGSETYYLISTEEQLRAIAAGEYGMDKNFLQKSTIQLSDKEWMPIGTKEAPFTGSYNGNGFEIIGLTITDPNATRIGMFGWTENANIYNITLRDYDIESAGRNAKRISVAPIVPVVTNGTRCYDNHVYPAESPESASVLVKPCPQEVKISSLYGKDNENSVFNKGIDYMAAKGTEVYAAADGKVLVSEDQNNGYGITVIIDHGGDLATLYAHLDEALVSKGDEVKAGDLIGYSGHTGFTYGDTLHFEVRENGQHVDPMNYFKI
ncbi:MAG: peptidoglycan DD-metalloendopeptidase family protein [Oscillospiraceae bacterium]|nr:peptidoglycan DD-metalloendopeptidase family protein [Oscillospiraceae bacterium]